MTKAEKQPRRSGSGPSAKNSASQKKRKTRSEEAKEKSIVKVYYPAFENLIIFLLDRRTWWRALKSYVKKEAGYRGGLLGAGILLFVLSIGFFFTTLLFLSGSIFLAIQLFTNNYLITTLLMCLVSLFLGMILMIIVLNLFRKLFDFSKYTNQKSLVRHEDDDSDAE